MNHSPLKSQALIEAKRVLSSARLTTRISAVLDEDEAYAADKLVELAEEILQQLAAVGIIHYLKHDQQREMYNDFLVQLFNSPGNTYNAGPLYRWAANMVAECPVFRASDRFRFFWQDDQGQAVICQKVHRLSDLRNRVMHGFFVLPPEQNREEAQHIGLLLLELHECGFFTMDARFHFWNEEGFTGQWNTTLLEHWNLLVSESSFGLLAKRVILENSDVFWLQEEGVFSDTDETLVPLELKEFVLNNRRGAFACWFHPNDQRHRDTFAAIGQWLCFQTDTLVVAYTIHETGISFTESFLLDRLASLLPAPEKPFGKDKKLAERVKAQRESFSGKVLILVDEVQTALFSPLHIIQLANFFFENDILLVAIGQHYGHFDRIFNQCISIEHPAMLPDEEQRKSALHNYLRFKGPFADKKEDAEDLTLLHEILQKLCDKIQFGKPIYARRFAEEYGYPMEYVHEIFALLQPWVSSSWAPFEEDTVDELHGVPTSLTEATPIYIILGRRDVHLEYQHKVLSL
jgi:hypothetical protein